jgi:hypothetical protein
VQVWANGTKNKLQGMGIPTWDYIHAMVKYDDGTDGIFESAWVLPDSLPFVVDFKYQIVGSEGTLWMDTFEQTSIKATPTKYSYPRVLGWAPAAWGAFINRVNSNDKSLDLINDGLLNTQLLVALHESLATGKIVEIKS